jgi:hypothetical protein
MYVELKTGFNDDGPAWIGRVRFSKTGRTLYYRGWRLQSLKGGGGMFANYSDIDTGDEFWVSGVKKNGQDRHWAGHGPVDIDEDVAEEYRRLVGL